MEGINWSCGVCGTKYTQDVKHCTVCLENFQSRRSVSEMTPDERGGEIIELLTGPFGVIPIETRTERIEELLGRKLKTYNDILCAKSCVSCRQALAEEAYSRQ